jgi:taurine dioxygenase
MALQTRPLANVGLEVFGFDINQEIDEDTQRELKSLWLDHGILLFRDQHITPEKQIEFSRIFGPLAMHPLAVQRERDYPELFQLENGGDGDDYNLAYYDGEPIVGRLDWHMDLHYTGQPNHGALLRAVILPEEDGLTGFGDLAKAYDALDEDMKRRIAGLEVAYVFNMQRRNMRFVETEGYEPGPKSPKKPSDVGFPDFNDSIYPIVVEHPKTGRRILEVVEQFLDRVIEPERAGLSSDEADGLLHQLVAHIRKPEFHYFHDWKEGDMVLWDNWRAMHSTTGTRPGVRRLIHRTTIEGDQALGRQLAFSSGITT